MIRRTTTCADGSNGWILITQVEHARLASQLLDAWVVPDDDGLRAIWAELRQAVIHHDDGWSDWERHPQVDSATGTPIDFTEMPLDDSLQIWRRSIEIAAEIGDLAGYTVAGHFTHLLQRSASFGSADDQTQKTQVWCAEIGDARRTWLDRWQTTNAALHSVALANHAVRLLQAFDAASLWLCCGRSAAEHPIDTGLGPVVVLAQRDEFSLAACPWPFRKARVVFEVVGTKLAESRFDSSEHLDRSDKRPLTLRWRLLDAPSSEGSE